MASSTGSLDGCKTVLLGTFDTDNPKTQIPQGVGLVGETHVVADDGATLPVGLDTLGKVVDPEGIGLQVLAHELSAEPLQEGAKDALGILQLLAVDEERDLLSA
jgi:hypothetical protein